MVWPLILCCALSVWGDSESSALESRIRSLIDSGQIARAEQRLATELRRHPDWEQGHLLLAQVFHQTGRLPEARREALTANRIRKSYDACVVLAKVALDSKELNESIDWLSQASAARPEEPEVYKLLGMVYALGGVKQESAAAFFQAIRRAPRNWEYHYLAGRALYDLERFAEAKREFAVAIELNAASVRAWTALGQLQERTQDLADAERSYRTAVMLCGDRKRECGWPLLELGRVTETRSEAEAQQYFAKAVAARPDWAKPHYYLGKALAAREEFEAARKELESAVRLDGSRPEYFYQLGQVCRQLGDKETAKHYLMRFREVQAEQEKSSPMQLEQP